MYIPINGIVHNLWHDMTHMPIGCWLGRCSVYLTKIQIHDNYRSQARPVTVIGYSSRSHYCGHSVVITRVSLPSLYTSSSLSQEKRSTSMTHLKQRLSMTRLKERLSMTHLKQRLSMTRLKQRLSFNRETVLIKADATWASHNRLGPTSQGLKSWSYHWWLGS